MSLGDRSARARLLLILGAVLLLSGVLRFLFAWGTDTPSADPWRHMALVRNLREGRGFTLFAGQPYIWYGPLWYWLAASICEPEGVKWLTAAVSTLCAPLLAVYLYRAEGGDARTAAIGGLLAAGFGPMVAFNAQLGAEAFSTVLLLAALALTAWVNRAACDAVAGCLFGLGVASRLQIAPDGFLFWPLLARPRRLAIFLAGAAVPVAAHWWRNHRVIESYAFVFTWDGLATDSGAYDWISTLAVQLHPAAAAATRALYEQIVPLPEWLFTAGRYRWEMVVFVAVALACVGACRRAGPMLAAASTIVFFAVFDRTLSSHFARIWVGIVPVFVIAVAIVASRLIAAGPGWKRAAGALVVGVVLVCGAPDLRPEPMFSLDSVTPPPEALRRTHYLVNSAFYHPESLVYRYPGIQFLGMPLEPDQFERLRRMYPEYRAIIWHRFNVQTELERELIASDEYVQVAEARSSAGYPYWFVEPRDGSRSGERSPGSK